MPVHTVFLFVADAIGQDKLTNRHFVPVVNMQEVAFVTTLALVANIVNAHLLLALLVTYLVGMRIHMGFHLVVTHLLVDLA